ncbi:hypothetical protein MKK70_28930 [Methylobacterium sp. E-041]|uniref:hypothetical protein n=1 Tax=Methylobacterium sp. E-041 TaxID=2836573 RepID=UPI001FB93862|nr:hypothetical protein [Methylobacterium sp. E-041]MCJ2109319.1 hypothetical protein [Methylobacterium sp. E-041]
MAAKIGLGRATLRAGVHDASRYVAPPSFHPGAAWIAAAVPLLGLFLALGAR